MDNHLLFVKTSFVSTIMGHCMSFFLVHDSTRPEREMVSGHHS